MERTNQNHDLTEKYNIWLYEWFLILNHIVFQCSLVFIVFELCTLKLGVEICDFIL